MLKWRESKVEELWVNGWWWRIFDQLCFIFGYLAFSIFLIWIFKYFFFIFRDSGGGYLINYPAFYSSSHFVILLFILHILLSCFLFFTFCYPAFYSSHFVILLFILHILLSCFLFFLTFCYTAGYYSSHFLVHILLGIFFALCSHLVRNVLGTKTLGDILSDRESIALEMQTVLDEGTEPWGVKVERVEVMFI